MTNKKVKRTGFEVAIIGMTGRFPNAKNLSEYWVNLIDGVESVTFLKDEKIPEDLKSLPNYVPCVGAVLEDKYKFDANFFGFTPNEAELLHPQSRQFLEIAWSSIEDAGYNIDNYKGRVGVFAGASSSSFWEALVQISGKLSTIGRRAARRLIDKDHLATLVAYKLGLKGPSYLISCACSTSLVAVHQACHSLISGECEMAIAGGANIGRQDPEGYMYEENMISSADGHCRAFDADANGTVGGNGVGVVVLKMLDSAIKDRDNIHAIIKGTAINNDGNRKVGYAAPSLDGQIEVINSALNMAELEPENLSYIEAHGTGTKLGDMIEVEALNEVLASSKNDSCVIGSVKSNIGHLDAAAGIAGLFKAVLMLKNKMIPPSININTPNPIISNSSSPLTLNLKPKALSNSFPNYAGVSAFGQGGTNAHVIIEEADSRLNDNPNKVNMLLFSARNEKELQNQQKNIGNYLKNNPDINISDVAYTLMVGRKSFAFRSKVMSSDINSTISTLTSDSTDFNFKKTVELKRKIVFMFSGIGSQYVGVGKDLYNNFTEFKKNIDYCCKIANTFGKNILSFINYDVDNYEYLNEQVQHPHNSHILIFVIEYALAQLLISFGIRPKFLIGYSFGEYVAACLAGVFSVEDAIKLTIKRSELISKTKKGIMVSVPLDKESLSPHLNNRISIAIENGPSSVVAGESNAIQEFIERMKSNKLMCVPLSSNYAPHSDTMDSILDEFEEILNQIKFSTPNIPIVSNTKGTFIDNDEIVKPSYWVKHIRNTVKFSDGLNELMNDNTIFIEVGIGFDLCLLGKQILKNKDKLDDILFNFIKPKSIEVDEGHYLTNKLGQLWMQGIDISWNELYKDQERYRISLPTYPFNGQVYEIKDDILGTLTTSQIKGNLRNKINDWYYTNTWKQKIITGRNLNFVETNLWLIFVDDYGVSDKLHTILKKNNQDIIFVHKGFEFCNSNNSEYTIDPTNSSHYLKLFEDIDNIRYVNLKILHLWNFKKTKRLISEIDKIEDNLNTGYFCLFYLSQALGKINNSNEVNLIVLTNNVQLVDGKDLYYPENSTIFGALKVIPDEYLNIRCCNIDYDLINTELNISRIINSVLTEIENNLPEKLVAYRNNLRWIQLVEKLEINLQKDISTKVLLDGVYLITGGLGGIGYSYAHYLAKNRNVKLIILGRSKLPERSEWEGYSDNEENNIQGKINKLIELEKLGSQVVYCQNDFSSYEETESNLNEIIQKVGEINGVIHAAGLPDGELIHLRTYESIKKIIYPKIYGTIFLDQILNNQPLHFFVNCSSLTSITGGMGQFGYTAANIFLDYFSQYSNHLQNKLYTSVCWDTWDQVGMGKKMLTELSDTSSFKYANEILQNAIKIDEGIKVIDTAILSEIPQILVSVRDFGFNNLNIDVKERSHNIEDVYEIKNTEDRKYARPELSSEYVEPKSKEEKLLADLLKNFLGYEKVGIHDNFFEFGMTSLSLIQFNNLIKKELNYDVAVVSMFEFPTILSLSEHILTYEESNQPDSFINESDDLSHDLLVNSIDLFTDEDEF